MAYDKHAGFSIEKLFAAKIREAVVQKVNPPQGQEAPPSSAADRDQQALATEFKDKLQQLE